MFLGGQTSGGRRKRPPKFLTEFYKSGSTSIAWQSLVTIGEATLEIRRRKKKKKRKDLNFSGKIEKTSAIMTTNQWTWTNWPSSPPNKEKSRRRIDHFWMCCALDVAFLLTSSMPCWIASNTCHNKVKWPLDTARQPNKRSVVFCFSNAVCSNVFKIYVFLKLLSGTWSCLS